MNKFKRWWKRLWCRHSSERWLGTVTKYPYRTNRYECRDCGWEWVE